MSDLWFLGWAEPWAQGGFWSPDPVTLGDTSWTWDLEFTTNNNQWTYARTSLSGFMLLEGVGYVFSGIVAYKTRGSGGTVTSHPVGQSADNGVAAFMNDTSVNSVTFGWGIGGENFCMATVNFEVWVSG